MNVSPDDHVLRAQCAALWKHTEMSKSEIAYKLGRSESWVRKWCEESNFLDKQRVGRPRSALTPENLTKLNACKVISINFGKLVFGGKLGKSNRVMPKTLGIGKSSVSRGFKELGLFAFRLSTQSKLTKKHIKIRFEKTALFRKHQQHTMN